MGAEAGSSYILGDLREEHRELAARWGRIPAEAWYWAQIVSIGRRSASRQLFGWGGMRMETIVGDLRFAFRRFHRHPLFPAAGVLTLALGIGSSTAMFSVIHDVLLYRSLFPDPDHLVSVFQAVPRLREIEGRAAYWDRLPISLQQYQAWREDATQFQGVAIHRTWEMTRTGLGEPHVEIVGVASSSLLQVLGIQPIMGRWFLPEEEGFVPGAGAPVAVLSHEMWTGSLEADPGILGETVTLDERPFTVVGILPRGFSLRWLGAPTTDDLDTGQKGIWLPLGATGGNMGGGPRWEGIGRLARGATLGSALQEAQLVLLPNADPAEQSLRVIPRSEAETRGLGSPLVLLFGASGLLLLIACANVAMLTLGEMPGRQREITTRVALGAGPYRIGRQLIVESVLLGVFGSVFGAGTAWATVRFLARVAPPIPRIQEVGIDLPVFFFAAAAGTLAGLLFGVSPALAAARLSRQGSLQPSRSGVTLQGQRVQRGALLGQVALTVVLLVMGGLLTRSHSRLLEVDPGFDPESLVSAHLSLPESRYPGGDEHPEGRRERWRFYQEVLAGAEAVPGVASAGMASAIPFPGKNNINITSIRDRLAGSDATPMRAVEFRVSPGYLETLGVPLLAGRMITAADDAQGNPVMVISESMARRYWPDRSPVGSSVRHWAGTPTIIGVVGDVRRADLTSEPEPTFYLPLAQIAEWVADPHVVLRTREDPSRMIQDLREVIWSLDPDVPVDQIGTMHTFIASSAGESRFRTLLMGVFSVLATLLAAAGVFGITARTVAHRSRDLGIQMALGAREKRLIGSTMWQAAGWAGIGVLLGLGGALWAAKLLAGFLFGIRPADPLVFSWATALALSACLLASYLPARRITSLRPADVLKEE